MNTYSCIIAISIAVVGGRKGAAGTIYRRIDLPFDPYAAQKQTMDIIFSDKNFIVHEITLTIKDSRWKEASGIILVNTEFELGSIEKCQERRKEILSDSYKRYTENLKDALFME